MNAISEVSNDHTFSALPLLPELLRAVAEEGYTQPTPIQSKAIPEVLAGRDLLAAAQTGTGKTAGFVLPILQRLHEAKVKGSPDGRRPPRVLILTPTRELAAQIEESVRTYGRHLSARSTVVYGGVGMQPQVTALRRGVDILVATPGRLLDHHGQRTVDLSRVEILVLDEADRMLDMGFIRDIRRVLALLPAKRQNLLFSATFSPEIRELAGSFLDAPAVVEVARRNAAAELVTHLVHPVDHGRKRALLAKLIAEGNWAQVLVFTRTKHGANRLAEELLRAGITAAAIHGNKSQSHRTRTLADFKRGELRVLVATDLAARGLDIEALPHVVNFELPNVAEDYVHRIGRTGRAGASGEAVSLVSHEERSQLAAIERLIRQQIEQRVVPGFEPGAAPAASHPAGRDARGRGRDSQRRPEGRRASGGHGEPRGRSSGAPRRDEGSAGRHGRAAPRDERDDARRGDVRGDARGDRRDDPRRGRPGDRPGGNGGVRAGERSNDRHGQGGFRDRRDAGPSRGAQAGRGQRARTGEASPGARREGSGEAHASAGAGVPRRRGALRNLIDGARRLFR